MITIPRMKKGRPSDIARTQYQSDLQAFASGILKIKSTLPFQISARGWCYQLESAGIITKGEFADAESVINECRKNGMLPINICAEDVTRMTSGIEYIDKTDPNEYIRDQIEVIHWSLGSYKPISFWDSQEYYIEMLVEKIDLLTLFEPICKKYYIPITNAKGWLDINGKASIMRRFMEHEKAGRRCVLLYCGDHDPAGLLISDRLLDTFIEMEGAVGWNPRHLIIKRFGLNSDFINAHGLVWLENLETSSGRCLSDPKHPQHSAPHVQTYLKTYGKRKCEANALVVRPSAGRQLCSDAIEKYLNIDCIQSYHESLMTYREEIKSLWDSRAPLQFM